MHLSLPVHRCVVLGKFIVLRSHLVCSNNDGRNNYLSKEKYHEAIISYVLFAHSNTFLESRLPGHIETLGEFFYYTGSCNDPTVLEEIKLNFIQQMEILEKNGYAGVCSDTLECNVGNVSVTCGPSSRKRRSIESDEIFDRFKRGDNAIRVEIKISSLFTNSNSSVSDSFEFAKQIQNNIFDKIKDVSNSGKLTINGLSPDAETFTIGFSAPVCPEGLYIRLSSLSCGKSKIVTV